MKGEYYKTKESVDEYIQKAKDVNGKALIDQLITYLQPTSSVLEIGSGPGTDWEILSATYQVTGSDFSKEFIQRLAKKFPNGTFLHLDASTLLTAQKFDAIYSNKVLHHLTDEELQHSIHRQFDLLNDKGIICHSFWKGEETEYFKGLLVNCHTKESLNKFFGQQFELIFLEEYSEFEEKDSLLLIGMKK
ncbi:class I SAM-dependent methyltransferase [Flammeovirga agarivorans]|uniref:Class I SAM-dependent methyltransferase n=1 Tax=Flammeovirga agarivorans TaxID=2726742 RepID=A0A7X8SJX7_9BACT|nr:class I SAM-dependent methyltransferase [Flammeovirga agarivorans]NLR91493.1 class I SAM-dependent methyltransferase [Flammeovirga agarivorans]